MPVRPPRLGARLSRRHFARVLTAACAALLTGAAACGDDDGPTGNSLNGTYTLQQIEGVAVPARFTDGTVLQSGSITISGGSSWTGTLVVDGQSGTSGGSVSRDGDVLRFTGDDAFSGQLSDNNRTLTADIDLFGDGQAFTMVFTR